MKKICISLFLLFIIILTIFISPKESVQTEYLRMHIRANSNSEIDQSVKYKVRDSVVSYLTPLVSECNTKQKTRRLLELNLSGIEMTANNVLKSQGFEYTCKARLTTEEFPLRVYEEYTLESGLYEALILELGSGKGDNWWCVVYPPLCFSADGEGQIKYKSKIKDIIKKFKNNE